MSARKEGFTLKTADTSSRKALSPEKLPAEAGRGLLLPKPVWTRTPADLFSLGALGWEVRAVRRWAQVGAFRDAEGREQILPQKFLVVVAITELGGVGGYSARIRSPQGQLRLRRQVLTSGQRSKVPCALRAALRAAVGLQWG